MREILLRQYGHLIASQLYEPVIGNGHTVRITTQIVNPQTQLEIDLGEQMDATVFQRQNHPTIDLKEIPLHRDQYHLHIRTLFNFQTAGLWRNLKT